MPYLPFRPDPARDALVVDAQERPAPAPVLPADSESLPTHPPSDGALNSNPSSLDGSDHLRRTLVQGFENRATLKFAEAAKLLNIDEKTLRKLVKQGRVPCRSTGTGRQRVRREFTLTDIESFYANAASRPACTQVARALTHVRTRPRVRGSFLADRAAQVAGRQKRKQSCRRGRASGDGPTER